MERLETRELSYFVTVAEELHFGRAAQRLRMAQPPLSRAIRQLERRIGVTLLDRTSRRVSLTPAGRVLLEEGRHVLDAVAAAERRTRRAASPEPAIVLAMKSGGDGGLLPGILAAYAEDPVAVAVDVVFANGQRAAMVRDGRADVAILHCPPDEPTGLDCEELTVEGQVALLPASHPLAARETLRVADLAGEVQPRWPSDRTDPAGPPGESDPSARTGLTTSSDPSVPPAGPVVSDGIQLMQLVALGRVVAVVPESVRGHIRHDIACVPVVDAPPVRVLIARSEQSSSNAIAALLRVAAMVAERH
ncbi:LysR family transcriptional regulator [Parafrankia sp. EUN1f]|uniref:LysR family transcriptional regulator n=1 Tax=Parafrankia sp. EUN1f TaxID=102897 RepID=UPI0001C47522|nr:LysR family transcriptional regulator [Parafrankia sp. EUN1f]EFC79543.1 transcriptional regulator, LysR family [Parafrankia sp. EUN1f]